MEEQLMSEDEKDYANTFRTMTSIENETEEAFPAHKRTKKKYFIGCVIDRYPSIDDVDC